MEGFDSLPFTLTAMLLCNGNLSFVVHLLGGADTLSCAEDQKRLSQGGKAC